MKKLFLSLLMLAGCFCGALNVSAWEVTDTVVADGYYYIRLDYYPDGTGNTGCAVIKQCEASDYTAYKTLYIANMQLVNKKSDLSAIWHIWRDAEDFPDGSPQYHIKNCGMQAETYLYPHRPVAAQSDYIFAVGTEQETYYFRTKDWGFKGIYNSKKKKYEGTSTPWKVALDRQDYCPAMSADDQKEFATNAPDSTLTPESKKFFIRPSSSLWRWRLGGSYLIKLNSFSGRQGASWWLQPVCPDSLAGGCVEWIQLVEAITDAKGMGLTLGDNPGNVSSEVALEAFENVLDEATQLYEEQGTKDEYVAMTAKVRAAIEQVKASIVPLTGGYVYLKNHFDSYGGSYSKFAVPYNDYQYRQATGSSHKLNQHPGDWRAYIRSHRWFGETYWWGYDFVMEPDVDAATAEESGLADKYIWKLIPQDDGNYLLKNMAPSEECGDTTYVYPTIRRIQNAPLVAAWCQMPMRGTPQPGSRSEFFWYGHNHYRLSFTDNFYPVNMGNHHFQTQNPVNSTTYGLWELWTVNPERITPKFELNGAITDAGGVFQEWSIGDKPGQVKESYFADLRAKLAEARELYANPSASDADMKAMTAQLDEVYKATLESLKDTDKVQNPIADGYYYIDNEETWNLNFHEANYYYSGIHGSFDDSGKTHGGTVPRDGKDKHFNIPGSLDQTADILDGIAGKVLFKGSRYTMFVNDEQAVRWDFNPEYIDTTAAIDNEGLMPNPDYRKEDIRNAWKITATGNKSKSGYPLYNVRNVATGGYLDLDNTGRLFLSDTPKEILFQANTQNMYQFSTNYYQHFNQNRAKGWYLIMDPAETYFMYCVGNIGGMSNRIEDSLEKDNYVGTTTSNFYGNLWSLRPLDPAVRDSFIAIGDNKERVLKMHNLLGRAEAALANATVPVLGDSLIKSTGTTVIPGGADDGSDTTIYVREDNQIWLNQVHNTAGNNDYSAFLDGTLTTFVHSRYSTAGGPLSECTEYNAVVVDLKDNPSASIAFKHGMRGNANLEWGPLEGAPRRYGSSDWGYQYRPVDIVVYGTNDTLSGWNEVTYIKDIPAIKDQRIYTSPLITAPEPYRFYKFSVLKNVNGNMFNGHPHIAPGYFQVYSATADAANSPTAYNSDINDAAAKLKTVVDASWAAYKANSVSEDQLTTLTEATENLEAIVPNSWRLLSRIYEAKVLRDSTYTEDDPDYQQYGDVTEAEKAAFVSAIETAETAMAPESHPTIESLNSAYDALNTAFFDFNAKKKTFETDTWYYITSTEYQNYSILDKFAWRGNQHMYACGDIPQEPLTEGKMGNIASPVRWGHYGQYPGWQEGQVAPKNLGTNEETGETFDYRGGRFDDGYSPYSQWRIVALPEKGDSIYAIQNRANGLYLGRRQDYTNGVYNYVTLSKEPMPVQIVLLGRNQYEVLPCDSTCGYYSVQADVPNAVTGKMPTPNYEIGIPSQLPIIKGVPDGNHYNLHSQGSDFHIVWWSTETDGGYNSASAYTFSKGSDMNPEGGELILDDDPVLLPTKNNSIKIVTLPYAVDFSEGIYTTNEAEAVTYALKNVNQGEEYTVELTRKDVFEAGEPFIIRVGNPQPLVTDGQDSIGFYVYDFDTAENGYQFDVKPANGLVGVMYGDSIKSKLGIGIDFGGSTLLLSKDTETYYIPGHGGYIDPSQVTDAGTAVDYTIGGLAVAVQKVMTETDEETVNVYTADGKLVKANAKKADAKAGLTKGIYIVGKQKIIVK